MGKGGGQVRVHACPWVVGGRKGQSVSESWHLHDHAHTPLVCTSSWAASGCKAHGIPVLSAGNGIKVSASHSLLIPFLLRCRYAVVCFIILLLLTRMVANPAEQAAQHCERYLQQRQLSLVLDALLIRVQALCPA
eukprot:1160135-Pelagomonas_calceolata.AAC.14